MVSFSCEVCGDVLTKKKLDPHRNRCRGATFTCIDCMVHFPGTEYRAHTSCMTEDQKYQGALYKNKKVKPNPPKTTTPTASTPKTMAHAAYVEEVVDEYGDWRDYEDVSDDDDDLSAGDLPPEAPTPPPADEGPVNVFDFLVDNATPTASNINLPRGAPVQPSEDTQLVRFDYEANGLLDSLADIEDEDDMVEYGTGPVPTSTFATPAPKAARKKTKDGEKDAKKDKKRKRLHIETDQVMTDAPPVLHSGLTGGLNRLMSRPSVFPPSPDYSGGDIAETPASPLKKTKHSKHGKTSRAEAIGNSLMAMISSSSSKTKPKKRKAVSATATTKKHQHRHRLEGPKDQKLIEFRPGSKDSKDGKEANTEGALVLFKPPAEHFLSFVNKGPDSDRGCSMNKALKRWHRERDAAAGVNVSKLMEEKELWRSLRLKKNDRGEIVLFSV